MKSVLVTMAPAIGRLDQHVLAGARAASAMINLGEVPSVALSNPPTASPVFAATDSVAVGEEPRSGTWRGRT